MNSLTLNGLNPNLHNTFHIGMNKSPNSINATPNIVSLLFDRFNTSCLEINPQIARSCLELLKQQQTRIMSDEDKDDLSRKIDEGERKLSAVTTIYEQETSNFQLQAVKTKIITQFENCMELIYSGIEQFPDLAQGTMEIDISSEDTKKALTIVKKNNLVQKVFAIFDNRMKILGSIFQVNKSGHYCKKTLTNLGYSFVQLGNDNFIHIPKSHIIGGAEKKLSLAVNIDNGDIVAYIKQKQNLMSGAISPDKLVFERCMGNPYLPEVYGIVQFENTAGKNVSLIISKLYPKGDAYNDASGIDIPRKKMIRWSLCIARALQSMHKKNMTHNDLKHENFLKSPDDEEHLLLSDFGGVEDWQDFDEKTPNLAGTYETLAPERFSQTLTNFNVHQKGDIYSLGACFFYQKYKKNVPWGEREVVHNVPNLSQVDFDGQFPEPSDINSYEHLFWEMLHFDPNQRPTIDDVVIRLEKMNYLVAFSDD